MFHQIIGYKNVVNYCISTVMVNWPEAAKSSWVSTKFFKKILCNFFKFQHFKKNKSYKFEFFKNNFNYF